MNVQMDNQKGRWVKVPSIHLSDIIHRFDDPVFVMLRYWTGMRNPIYRLETSRPLPTPAIAGTSLDNRATRVIYQLVVQGSSIAGCLVMPLFFIIPFIPWIWRIPTLISTGPLVAREVEKRTWSTLRSTPYSAKQIIEAMHAAGTYRTAFMWAYVTGMRAAVVSILGMIIAILAWTPGSEGMHMAPVEWIAYLVCAFYFLAEPLIDTAIDGAVGILGSTLARTQLMGTMNAVLLRLILWSMQLMSLAVVLPITNAVLERNAAANAPKLVIFGPAYALTMGYAPEAAIVMVITLIIARVVALRLLMALTTWRAEVLQE
jgi:hypothetical protein